MAYQIQTQALIHSTNAILAQRAEHSMSLAAPFTVLAKKIDDDTFGWIAYSIGRPRNIVWGLAYTDSRGLVASLGCSWESLKIINKMLDTRKVDGYAIVSTYAKDQVNLRIFGHLIYDAYHSNNSVQYGKYRVEAKRLQDTINDICIDSGNSDILNASRIMATGILEDKNIAQYLQKGTKIIPQSIIGAIHDYLEHNTVLSNTALPETCPQYETCERDPTEACDLYQGNFALL
jgi:hypothetical protein